MVYRNAFKTPSRLFCAGQNPIDHDGDFFVADSALFGGIITGPQTPNPINDFSPDKLWLPVCPAYFFSRLGTTGRNHFCIHFMARRATLLVISASGLALVVAGAAAGLRRLSRRWRSGWCCWSWRRRSRRCQEQACQRRLSVRIGRRWPNSWRTNGMMWTAKSPREG